jgi:hypothetical protein
MNAGTGTIAFSYYLKPKAPSFFFSGGLGYSSWNATSKDGNSTSTGAGLMLGAGYEFLPHWSGELNFDMGNPSKSGDGLKVTTKTRAILLTINGMFY